MIKINLLPHHLRPIKRSPIPYLACAGLFVAVLLYIAVSFVATQAQILSVQAELDANQAELDSLKQIVEESNQLEQLKLQLADKIETINEIVSNRIVWSRELWNLSRLKPDNFWYSEIAEASKTYSMQEPEIDPKTGKPAIDPNTKKVKMKTVNITRPILRVSGYVVGAEDGRSDVSPLTDALTSDPEFSRMFQLEPPSFQDTEFEGFPVKKFTLEFLIAPEAEAAQ